jgi:Protein of unknown function (DUF3592)
VRKPDRWLAFLQVLKWIGFVQGAVFAIVAVGFACNTVVFISRSAGTTGTVTALDQHQDDEGSISFSPEFSFVAGDGSPRIAHSNSSSNPPGFEVGERVPVRYEKNDPSDARIATFWQTWPFAAGSAIASFVTWLVGLFFRWKVIRRKTRKPKLQQIQSLDQI